MSKQNQIRLIVRADDIASSHSATLACIESFRQGIARSVEIMAPCAWFPEAVELLKSVPELEVGVHLTLTSEWAGCKWRPVSHAPSLVTEDGFFFPLTSHRQDAPPPNQGFLQCGYLLEEVERELRAQIELTLRHVNHVTHLSSHMGAPTCMPDLLAVTQRLADEYGLILDLPDYVKPLAVQRNPDIALEERLADALATVHPGTWLFVEHPAYDDAEMQALSHGGDHPLGLVARQRAGVLTAFTSPKVRQIVEQRGIELINYTNA